MADERVRVLIAEESANEARLLADQLDAVPGLAVVGTAGSGEEALELVEKLRPEVLVLALFLTGMTGIGVLQALRGMEAERRPRVIVLSALKKPDMVQRVMDLGADFYFTKPCRVQELVQLLWRPGRPSAEVLLERMLGEGHRSRAFFWAMNAIEALAREPKLLLKEAYGPSMDAEGLGYANVEKGIRNVIQRAEERNSATYSTYFRKRPSNGVFLRRLAKEIEVS